MKDFYEYKIGNEERQTVSRTDRAVYCVAVLLITRQVYRAEKYSECWSHSHLGWLPLMNMSGADVVTVRLFLVSVNIQVMASNASTSIQLL